VTDRESLARIGIAVDLLVVLSQAVLAVWFFKLFRSVNVVAALALTAYGLVNAVMILGGTAFTITALTVASDPALSVGGSAAGTVQLMYTLGTSFWSVGGLFFGLWLIPMGRLVLESGWMPRPLGWVLYAGGASYILNAFITYLAPGTPAAIDTTLSLIATVGEFWMLGYLIIFGVRRAAVEASARAATVTVAS
jgi:hypothetical protein